MPDEKEKHKFITIWKAGEDNDVELKSVGPQNFKALMKLGQGSFGVVYLVVKLIVDPNTKQTK